jgi:hypothetical protein
MDIPTVQDLVPAENPSATEETEALSPWKEAKTNRDETATPIRNRDEEASTSNAQLREAEDEPSPAMNTKYTSISDSSSRAGGGPHMEQDKGKGLAMDDTEMPHEDIADVLAGLESNFPLLDKGPYSAALPYNSEQLMFEIGKESSVKALYEGPQKCSCCINWVEEYPDNLKEGLLGTREIQKHAIVTKNIRNHKGTKPTALHSIDIQSPSLKKVLERVFEGYRGITPGLDNLTFSTPFQAFFQTRSTGRGSEASRRCHSSGTYKAIV